MKFKKDVIQAAIRDRTNGMTVPQIQRKYGIKARSTVFLWLQQSKPVTENDISRRELYEMKVELGRLRKENTILKAAGCSAISPIAVRQAAFERLSRQYPLKTLCRILNLSQGDAHYIRDHKVKVTLQQKADAKTRPLIASAFEESRHTYGKRRIRAVLRQRHSLCISERKVSQLMRELDLVSKHLEYHWIRDSPRCVYYPNRLQQQFDPPDINTRWCADLTYVRVRNEWRYIFSILDLCKRRIIGWGLSDCKASEFTTAVLKSTFFSRGEPMGLMYHCDQGTENTEYLQKEWSRNHDIIRSYSKSGKPHDNAVAESLFATIKKEFVCKRVFESDEQLYYELEDYIQFYNEIRLHSHNGYVAPCESEQRLQDGCVKILD